jgi:diguanylate cyclase (GGDEF)-like protein
MKIFTEAVPDQYYAMTSRLTARGHQRTAMRVVAGCILILGLPAFLAAANPRASNIPLGRTLLAVIPLACLAFASPWLRYRWPTRGQSTLVVTLGAVVLSAGCIVPINPFSGLLTATAFPFVLGYAALFHGTRIQLFAAAFAAVTIASLSIRIAMTDVPTALAVTTPVVLINVAVLIACRIVAEVAVGGTERTDIEPLTGLLNRKSFDELAATMIGARNRDDDRFLVLVTVGIDGFDAVMSVQGRRGFDSARIAVATALRETVRRDAVIGHVGEAEFLVADTFTTPDPAPLAERIRSAVAATPGGFTASIGIVCTPLRPLAERPPHEVLDDVIALATIAMHQARGRGGNSVEYIMEGSE